MDEGEGPGTLAEDLRALEEVLARLSDRVAVLGGAARQTEGELAATAREAALFSGTVGRGLRRAFDGLVVDGQSLSEALRGLGRSILEATYAAALRPVQAQLAQGIGAALGGLLPFAQGGAFAQGRVVPFAQGGIVSGPVSFPMRGGATGLMGEAGPEAIMPLSRGADGRLGVRMEGGGRPVSVTVNVSTPDVEGFRRSEAQIAAQLGRALARGQRLR